MNEKKTVLSVILGVSLVTLISAIVMAVIDSFTLLLDYGKIRSSSLSDYNMAFGLLELLAVLFGIACIVAVAVVKNKRIMLGTIFAVAMVAYFIITTIIMRFVIVEGKYIYSNDYALFTAYLTNMASLTVSCVVSSVSFILLTRLNNKSQAQTVDVADSTQEQTKTVNADNSYKSE